MTIDPRRPIVYAVSAGTAGGENLVSLAVDGKSGALSVMNRTASGGGDATYLHLDPASQSLLSANYGTGQVSVVPVNADGTLGAMTSIRSDTGTGPSPRQTAPHAHSVVLDPTGHYALVADLGADRVFVYSFDAGTRQLTSAATPFEATPPGTGPRHLAFHPNGKFVFLVSELSAEVRSYGWDASAGKLNLLQTVEMTAPDYNGKKSGGEITVSDDGRFVYASERGQSQIIVYAVDTQTGQLREIQRLSAQGIQPWQFAFDPSRKWFLVANESSSLVTTFRVDKKTGKLTPSTETLSVPRPVTVTFPATD
jgi:6-phosphogluconolactonase